MARPQAPVGAPREVPGSSDHRRRLEAARDLLESRLHDADDRNLAALTARYVDVLDKLAAIPPAPEVSAIDDLTARRARKPAATA